MIFLKKYKLFIIGIIFIMILVIINKEMGLKAVNISSKSFIQMLLILPSIFILIGLLDVWIPKEIMVQYMGKGSGVKGIALAFFIGSIAAGPLFGAFPLTAILLKKGASFFNIFILLGAWSTTKIPMFIFELSTLGPKFAFTRLAVDIPGIIIIAFVLNRIIKTKEKEIILKRVNSNSGVGLQSILDKS